MKRIVFLLMLLALCGASAKAQFTLVSGTVTDPNGLPWACGTISAQLVNNNGVSATLNGVSFSASTAPVKLGCPTDPTTSRTAGFFQMQLADNTVIKCGIATCGTQTTWQFTVNSTGIAPPQGTGPQSFTQAFTISGTSQTLSFTSVPTLSLSSGGSASSPAPIMGFYLSNSCVPGILGTAGLCYNTPANTQQNNQCSWTSGSAVITCFTATPPGTVSASVTANVATFTYAPYPTLSGWAVGNSITITGFTAGDTFYNITCTLSAVTPTSVSCPLVHANAGSGTFGQITNTTVGPFVSADVGKRAYGYQVGRYSLDTFGNNHNNPITAGGAVSIQTFISSTQVSLSFTSANTVATNIGSFVWGNPDDTAAAAMDAAMLTAAFCPKFHLAAANYFFTVPHFVKNPLSCLASGVLIGTALSQQAGNIVYSAGFELEGRGSGTTVLYTPPGFPETGACTNGFSGKACWVIPPEGRWSNLQITGVGNSIAPNVPANSNFIEVEGPASLDNFVCANFGERGPANGIINGLAAYVWAQITQLNLSGCGSRGIVTPPTSSVTIIRAWIENYGNWGMGIGSVGDYYSQPVSQFSKYNLICYDCTISQESMADPAGQAMLVNNGLKIKWYRGGFTTLVAPSSAGTIGYLCQTTPGCLFDAEDGFFDISQPGAGTGFLAFDQTVAGTVALKNSLVGSTAAASGGRIYTDVAGSLFQNLGGNTFAAGSTTSQFVVNGNFSALSSEAGQVTCAASAATITFKNSYLFNPSVLIQDQTTAGAVTQTSLSTTTKVVGCPGATDVLNYTVTPNPI